MHSLSRRIIIHEYESLKKTDRRSDIHLVRQIAEKFGYNIDKNGTNTYIMKVVKTVGVN